MRVLVLTACLSSLFVNSAFAQDPGPPLTLRAAMTEALARNPELIALGLEQDSVRASVARERFLMPPMLEAQVWGWPVTTLNPARTEMYMLMAEQDLPGRGKRAARTLVAEREADMSRQQIAVRANQILSELRHVFIDLAYTRATFDLYSRQALLLEDVAETATLRYASGQGPQQHTVVALVEIASLHKARIAADELAQAAEARLNTLLGRPPAQPVEPLAPIAPTVSPEAAERLALVRHPQIGMVTVTVAREQAELERVRAEQRPDYVLGGGYMLRPGQAGAWTARAGITWPNAPWSRGGLTAAIESQARRVEAAQARGAVIAAQLRQDVREATVRLDAAERQVRLIESTVLPQIERAFELARFSYGTGEGLFTDVLDARRMLLASQLEYVDAQASVARARAELETVAGVL